jgi:acyl-CoA thioesterase FadM
VTNLNGVYTRSFTIPEETIDENGHANNVAYVQWIQAGSALLSNTMLPSAASKRREKCHLGGP